MSMGREGNGDRGRAQPQGRPRAWTSRLLLAALGLTSGVLLLQLVFGDEEGGVLADIFLLPLAGLSAALFVVLALLRHDGPRAGYRMLPLSTWPEHAAQGREDELDRALASRSPQLAAAVPPRPQAWSGEVLTRLDWRRFEELCCELFRDQADRLDAVPLGTGGGADLHLHRDQAAGPVIVCCRTGGRPVGLAAVQALAERAAAAAAVEARFVSPRGFVAEAAAFAAEHGIVLIGGDALLTLLEDLPPARAARLLALATEGAWTTPSCPLCGGRMAAREGEKGRYWGCLAYPRCRGLLRVREPES